MKTVKHILYSIIIALCLISIGIMLGNKVPTRDGWETNYEKDTREAIEWKETNFKTLNIAFDTRDFDTINKLINENYTAASTWIHYGISKQYSYYDSYKNNLESSGTLEYYEVRDALILLYKPNYYGNIIEEDQSLLKEIQEDTLEILKKVNVTDPESLYNECKDEYGIDYKKLEVAYEKMR